MAVDGQRDPIKVVAQAGNPDLPWRLVTGMHRLIGARIEGLTVWAIEVHGKPEELADLEASENLHRRPLAPIERAKFVAALCEAARMRVARETGGVRQQQAAIRARWAKVKNAETSAEAALQEEVEDTTRHLVASYGWQESAADAFGLGIRDLQRALQLHRLIVEPFPDLIAGLAAHPVVGENGAQLKAVAGIRDEALRRKVIERLLADPELSADEARVQEGIDSPRGPAPSKELRLTSTISDSWSRLPLAARRWIKVSRT